MNSIISNAFRKTVTNADFDPSRKIKVREEIETLHGKKVFSSTMTLQQYKEKMSAIGHGSICLSHIRDVMRDGSADALLELESEITLSLV